MQSDSEVPCRAKVREPPPLQSRVRIMVKGLPSYATESFVQELFSSTGHLQHLEVRRKQRFASVAAMIYTNHSAALHAVERFDGYQLEDSGEILKVAFAACGVRDNSHARGGAANSVMHTFYYNSAAPSSSSQVQDLEVIKVWKRLWTQEGWCVVDRSIDRSIIRHHHHHHLSSSIHK